MIVHKSIYKFVETLLLFYDEEAKLEKLLEESIQLQKVLQQNTEFTHFLEDPSIAVNNKKDFVQQMLKPIGFDDLVINTMMVIVDNHLIKFIKNFFEILIKEIYVKLKIKFIYVTSDTELDNARKKKLELSFKNRLQASKVIFEYKIDPTLMLGIRVRYDDIIEELSIRSQLKKVERRLIKHSRAINFI